MNKTLAMVLVAGMAFGGTAFAQGASPLGTKLMSRLDQNADGKLSREELQAQAAKRFDAIDANKDGKLSQDEIGQHVAVKRAQRQAQRAERLRAADTDGDGKWSRAELGKLPERRFAKLDSNGDGFVTPQELDARKPQRAGRAERMLGRADVNKDGVVERAEALQLAEARFSRWDANGDGTVESSELRLGRHHGKHAGRCHADPSASKTDKS